MAIELGALSLAIRDQGGDAVLGKISAIDGRAKALGSKPVTIPVKAPGADETRAKLTQLTAAGDRARRPVAMPVAAPGATQAAAQVAGIGRAATASTAQVGTLGRTLASLRGMAGSVGAVTGVLGATALLGALGDTARAYDDTERAQRKLLASSKLTGAALADVQRIAKEGEATFRLSASASADLTANVVKLTSRAEQLNRSGEFMARWLDLAAANGLSADEAMQALQTTIIGQDEGLNRLGLSNPQQIYEAWGREAGVSAAKMTEVQKAQAIINEIVTKGTLVQGEYTRAQGTAAGRSQELARQTEVLKAKLGEVLVPLRLVAYGTGIQLATAFGFVVTKVGEAIAKLQDFRAQIGLLGTVPVVGPLFSLLRALTGDKAATPAKAPDVTFTTPDKDPPKPPATGAGASGDNPTAIAAALALTRARLAREGVINEAGYAQGLKALREYYAERSRIIAAETQAEIVALTRERGVLSRAAAGETADERRTRLEKLAQVGVQIETARVQGGANQQANYAARVAAERALHTTLLGFEQARMTAEGRTHEARLAHIAEETDAYRLALAQQGGLDAEQQAAQVAAFARALTVTAEFGAEQESLRREMMALDIERERITQQVALGQMSEAMGAERIAQLERSRLPVLREIVRRMAELAALSGDPELASVAKRIYADLAALGTNTQKIALDIGVTIGTALATGIQQGIASGSAVEGLKAMGASVLSAFGDIFIQIGIAGLAGAKLLGGLLVAISTLNPFAAAAVSIGLIALGAALKGAASSAVSSNSAVGGGGSGGFTGFGSGTSAPLRLTVADQQIRRATLPAGARPNGARPAAAPTGPEIRVIGATTPEGQRLIGTANAHFQRRGGV